MAPSFLPSAAEQNISQRQQQQQRGGSQALRFNLTTDYDPYMVSQKLNPPFYVVQ